VERFETDEDIEETADEFSLPAEDMHWALAYASSLRAE
jgi:uncharacterized protein (DUF433 family)